MEGRHFNILYLLCINYSMGLTPTMRSNVDYVFLFAEEEIGNMKRLYENYGGIFPSFRMFKETLDQCTEDFGCMVIDKRSRSKVLTDRVFHFKAQDPGPFKYGKKEFWDTHFEYVGEKIPRSVNMKSKHRNRDPYRDPYKEELNKYLRMYGGGNNKYAIIKHR